MSECFVVFLRLLFIANSNTYEVRIFGSTTKDRKTNMKSQNVDI